MQQSDGDQVRLLSPRLLWDPYLIKNVTFFQSALDVIFLSGFLQYNDCITKIASKSFDGINSVLFTNTQIISVVIAIVLVLIKRDF